MKIQGHAAGGWLATRLFLKHLSPADRSESNHLLTLGLIGGVLPDLDYLIYVFKKGRIAYEGDFRHHTWVTHTIPFYSIAALLLYMLGAVNKNLHLKKAAKVLSISTTAHLLQDTLGSGDGIMLFYPATKKMYGIGLSGLHGEEWNQHYTKTSFYALEKFIVITAIVTFFYDIYHNRKHRSKP
jgi:membrane-bound metal-dependent hydrolase YbcI (DUF457 family)